MKKTVLALSLLLCGTAMAGTGGMKAGLWELKVTRQVIDGKDMAAQMAAAQAKMQESMAKMTPQQRQQMEQIMKGVGVQGQNDGAIRMCISEAMAAKNNTWGAHDSKCPPTKVSQSGNKVTFEINCTADGHTSVGTGESTISGDKVTSHVDLTTTDARGKHTMVSDSQMTYLGADCKGIKPMEEIAHSMNAAKGR